MVRNAPDVSVLGAHKSLLPASASPLYSSPAADELNRSPKH